MFRSRVLMMVTMLLSLGFGSGSVSANMNGAGVGLSEAEEACYSVSMVGYDSVINSDLGLPLDEVIDTMVTNNDTSQTLEIYQDYLLLVVMEAYNWDGSPHTYAVKTMFQCAAKHGN